MSAAPSWFPSAWSPTSLAGLEICPRRWALQRAGWRQKPDPLRPAAPHAEFGQLWHAAAEKLDHERFFGRSVERATENVIEWVLDETWKDGAPWAGAAVDMWTCRDGIQHYTTKTGKPARKFLCEGARDWWMGAPAQCPKCAGPVEIERRYVPHHPTKNRGTLLRAVEAYCAGAATFEVAGDEHGPILEREFHFDVAGVPCHMIADRVSILGARHLGHERKTTARYPSRAYWGAMARTYQSAFYVLAAGVRDIVYEVVVIGTKGAEVLRQIVSPSADVVRETEAAVLRLMTDAHDAIEVDRIEPLDFLPRFASCATASGGQPCQFLSLCNAAEGARSHRLTSDFVCEPRRT